MKRSGLPARSDFGLRHFRAGGCTTFDTEEVQRMAMRQRQAVGFVDDELERLRAEFGDQGCLGVWGTMLSFAVFLEGRGRGRE